MYMYMYYTDSILGAMPLYWKKVYIYMYAHVKYLLAFRSMKDV